MVIVYNNQKVNKEVVDVKEIILFQRDIPRKIYL